MAKETQGKRTSVLIWDWPVRLFHWLVVLLVIAAYLTGEIWKDFDMETHKLVGYVLLGLIVFRLLWGFVGGRHARFFSFIKGPAAIWRHVAELGRRKDPGHGGHNALGALSVLALLLSLLVQVVSGLFNSDGVLAQGPLAGLVDAQTQSFFAQVHDINFTVLLVLIGLHLLAIVFYGVWKGQALVAAMVTGRRRDLAPEEAGTTPPLFLALGCILLAAAVVLVVVLWLPDWLAPAGGAANPWD